jgi:hypothetical protein
MGVPRLQVSALPVAIQYSYNTIKANFERESQLQVNVNDKHNSFILIAPTVSRVENFGARNQFQEQSQKLSSQAT